MKERNEDNELLNSFSGIKRKVRMKVGAVVIFLAIIMVLLLIESWKNGTSYGMLLIEGLVDLLLLIIAFIALKKMCQDDEKIKLYIAFVEKCLSIQKYTEVKPIDINAFKKEMLSLADSYIELLPLQKVEAEEYKNSILVLLETVKFYARISETKKDSVEIFVKYDNEEKLRYYKSIDKVSFLDEYSIQEEDQ